MNVNSSHDEAQEILDALRKIQDTPDLQTEAKTNPESVMNKLGLSGIARHAVAFGITAMAVGGAYAAPATGQGWWGG
jgi:hypothetical protein